MMDSDRPRICKFPPPHLSHGPLFSPGLLRSPSGAAQWLQPEDFARLCHCSLSLVLRREQRRMWQYYCHLEAFANHVFWRPETTRNCQAFCLDVVNPSKPLGLVFSKGETVFGCSCSENRFIAMLMYNFPIFSLPLAFPMNVVCVVQGYAQRIDALDLGHFWTGPEAHQLLLV